MSGINPETSDEIEQFTRLDSFGNKADIKRLPQCQKRRQDRPVTGIIVSRRDEGAVNFKPVGR